MPVIGVPIRYDLDENGKSILYIYESVRRCIQQAGGEVFLIIPVLDVDFMQTHNKDFPEITEYEKRKINSYIDKCDGLFLPGGEKFTPYDRYILEYAIEKDIPTLGVCLSMQMMGCFREEINLENNNTYIEHKVLNSNLCHSVKIDENSILYNILGKSEIYVNSFHNHHITENHIYKTIAKSPDGIIEAIEHPTATFNIGVQWHPEKNYKTDINSKLIIDYFIKMSEMFSKNKKREDRIEII